MWADFGFDLEAVKLRDKLCPRRLQYEGLSSVISVIVLQPGTVLRNTAPCHGIAAQFLKISNHLSTCQSKYPWAGGWTQRVRDWAVFFHPRQTIYRELKASSREFPKFLQTCSCPAKHCSNQHLDSLLHYQKSQELLASAERHPQEQTAQHHTIKAEWL